VGRRSRKRAEEAGTRAERDAARRERARVAAKGQPVKRSRPGRPGIDERPPAPWGSLPLSELVVLLGIALMVWGLVTWEGGGTVRFGAGLAVAALAGAELSLREHLAGYRSHTTLLSGVAAFVVVGVLTLTAGHNRLWIVALVAVLVFGGCFYGLRELFKRRSGGLGFR
jgi:Flp pilus assembly protein TadB